MYCACFAGKAFTRFTWKRLVSSVWPFHICPFILVWVCVLVWIDQRDPVPFFLFCCIWNWWEKSFATGTSLMSMCHCGDVWWWNISRVSSYFSGSELNMFLPRTVLLPSCRESATSAPVLVNCAVWTHSLLAANRLYSGSKCLAAPSCVLAGLSQGHHCISPSFLKCAWKWPQRGVCAWKSTRCALLVVLNKAAVIGVWRSL